MPAGPRYRAIMKDARRTGINDARRIGVVPRKRILSSAPGSISYWLGGALLLERTNPVNLCTTEGPKGSMAWMTRRISRLFGSPFHRFMRLRGLALGLFLPLTGLA